MVRRPRMEVNLEVHRVMKVRILVMMLLAAAPFGTASANCGGDCGDDGEVTVDELVLGVNIALGTTPLSQCASFDTSNDNEVTVDELVGAVNNALNGCPYTGQFYGSVTMDAGQSGKVNLAVQADGSATGTLKISDGGSATFFGDGGSAGLIATVLVSGTVDLDAGTFSLTGTYNDVAVTISGTLPSSLGGTGSLTVQIGSAVYSSTITTGDGSPTPTPTATRTATATPTPTLPLPTATNTQPLPTPTRTTPAATPTPNIVPPGIYAYMIGTWSGRAINEPTHVNKAARIKVEVRGNQVYIVDLNHNVFASGDIPMSVTPAAPQVIYSNRTIPGNKLESVQLTLTPANTLAGIYSTTTMAYPPTLDAVALELSKE